MAATMNEISLIFLDGRTAPVDGQSLNFAAGFLYVVNIGNVGDGSAASVAAAANRAYVVSDADGIAITAVRGGTGGITPGEHIIFMGQDNAGQAEFWFFGSTQGAVDGFVPMTSLFRTADTNGNHQVDPSEITHIGGLLGLVPSTMVGEMG